MKICVYGASSKTIDKVYTDVAEKIGELIGEKGHTLVFGGGASGVMGATALGAKKSNAKEILGIAPRFFDVDGLLSPYCTDFIYTEDMHERKKLFEEISDAFIIAPGGVGTYDELFELLTLKQLAVHNKPIVILNVNGCYDTLYTLLEELIKGNFMRDKSRVLYEFVSTPEQAFDYIENYKPHDFSVTEFKAINTDIKR